MEKSPQETKHPILPRQKIFEICEKSLACKAFRFGRQVLMNWLVVYPGDLQAALLLHRMLLEEGKIPQAVVVVKKLLTLDIEDRAVWEAAAISSQVSGVPVPDLVAGTIYALYGSTPQEGFLPEWSPSLRTARQSLKEGAVEPATALITDLIEKYPDNPLVMLTHLQVAAVSWPAQEYLRLALEYHHRCPDCLQFGLYLADAQIHDGDHNEAVSLLHHSAANDAAGQVVTRMWGKRHPYCRLWPEPMEMPFDIPIPAVVAGALGWNLLNPGVDKHSGIDTAIQNTRLEEVAARLVEQQHDNLSQSSHPVMDNSTAYKMGVDPIPQSKKENLESSDETIRDVEKAFDRMSSRLKSTPPSRVDGRFPVYVIFSTETGLLNQYGKQVSSQIKFEMANLARVVTQKNGWDSLVFLPDNLDGEPYPGVKQVEGQDPWKLKLALIDLDKALEKKGAMIGALLIVGGDLVVPFHRLPNPTEDVDQEVLSDNPYMTLDSNYFVPEWPAGRIPGEKGSNPALLIDQLRRIVKNHQSQKNGKTWPAFFLPQSWLDWLKQLFRIKPPVVKTDSLGYTAAVWEKASQAVYRTMGGSGSFYTCPPDDYASMLPRMLTGSKLGYYNLHGTREGSAWYGQRDSLSFITGSDYPVAIKPDNLVNIGSAPQAVVSEACYGANIVEKSIPDALSLKFIEIGTPVMVGSTCIAYGSIDEPLIGADLIASHFWKHYLKGLAAGDALQQAKYDLSMEMDRRQGFLDGEDQKTLISFILLGDPLSRINISGIKIPKAIQRLKNPPNVTTVCEHTSPDDVESQVPENSLHEIKLKLSVYLPGLDTADLTFSRQKTICSGKDHPCPATLNVEKKHLRRNPGNVVVTISKHIQTSSNLHYHFARATVDKSGKLIKLVVSR